MKPSGHSLVLGVATQPELVRGSSSFGFTADSYSSYGLDDPALLQDLTSEEDFNSNGVTRDCDALCIFCS